MRVAVIGGGPSGLTTLKYLITAHTYFPALTRIEAQLFEAEDSVGGTFKYRDYEDAELVSSRQLTTFSDYRYPSSSPDFLSTKEYVTYLEGYCKQFNLSPSISLSTQVVKIERLGKNKHIVHSTKNGITSAWECDAVAICTGLHVEPNIPDIPGLENVETVMHSSQFKERAQFGEGKDVLIVGSGETGMDIAYLAITSPTASVTISHRDGFLCAPKRAPSPSWFGMTPFTPKQGNVPYDINAASLFDTAYQHPLLRSSTLPWAYYDRFAKYTTWLVSGTKAGLDQWIGEISPERYHASKIFFNKSTKAMPFISAQYRKTSLVNTVRPYVALVPIVETGSKKIELAPWPESVGEKGVVRFVENGREEAQSLKARGVVCRPDIVVLATGYTQSFPFLDGGEYPVPAEANMRSIWKSGDESVGFIGFVRPSFGAIPPLSELQSQLWILFLLSTTKSTTTLLPSLYISPLPAFDYALSPPANSRINYGVDHESYAYQLALDIGSAPSLTSLIQLSSSKLIASWALSANVNPKFRLTGPWRWDGAQQVMETEIWDTVARRSGFFGHFTLSVLPMLIFGSLSAVLWVVMAVWGMLKMVWKLMVLSEV